MIQLSTGLVECHSMQELMWVLFLLDFKYFTNLFVYICRILHLYTEVVLVAIFTEFEK